MARVHQLDAAARHAVLVSLTELIAARQDVSFAFALGSFTHDTAFRDVDVAIWTTSDADPLVDLELGASLSAQIRLSVDVRRLNDAPLSFLFHALRGVPLLVRDEGLLADLMERTARQYHDLAPRLRRATREAFAA